MSASRLLAGMGRDSAFAGPSARAAGAAALLAGALSSACTVFDGVAPAPEGASDAGPELPSASYLASAPARGRAKR
jgi:hypothetical protein